MRPFRLLGPETLAEACSLLQEQGSRAVVLAGGTDLLVKWQKFDSVGDIRPELLINIKGLPELTKIRYVQGDYLEIGALVTHAQIVREPLFTSRFSLLAQACSRIGSPQIRNMGTIGGNICNASPAADAVTALLAMEAQVSIIGPSGSRVMDLADFLLGPGKTALERGEILTAIRISEAPGSASCYSKLGQRTSLEVAVVAVALKMEIQQGVCRGVRVALGAVAPTPVRALDTEQLWEGRHLTPELIARGAELAAAQVAPISDGRASAAYRKDMVDVLVKRGARGIQTEKREM